MPHNVKFLVARPPENVTRRECYAMIVDESRDTLSVDAEYSPNAWGQHVTDGSVAYGMMVLNSMPSGPLSHRLSRMPFSAEQPISTGRLTSAVVLHINLPASQTT